MGSMLHHLTELGESQHYRQQTHTHTHTHTRASTCIHFHVTFDGFVLAEIHQPVDRFLIGGNAVYCTQALTPTEYGMVYCMYGTLAVHITLLCHSGNTAWEQGAYTTP